MQYTALIRTHNSSPRVEQVVAALRDQTSPPARILAVDSGSELQQRRSLVEIVDDVVDYPEQTFNYSKAINVGVAHCHTPWVLIISSHVVLTDPQAIGRAIAEMQSVDAAGFYFHRTTLEWCPELIGRDNFDGRNGLHNTCAFVQSEAVRERPFREDVFSAEDQEWAADQFRRRDAKILRIGSNKMRYDNPNENEVKLINEEVSIAYFTCREKLGLPYLAYWLVRSVALLVAGRPQRSRTCLTIARELLLARFRAPVRLSRYY